MQKLATKIFVYASIAFGVFGLVMVITNPGESGSTPINRIFMKLVMASVFIILPSFALSVASKYLNGRK